MLNLLPELVAYLNWWRRFFKLELLHLLPVLADNT